MLIVLLKKYFEKFYFEKLQQTTTKAPKITQHAKSEETNLFQAGK